VSAFRKRLAALLLVALVGAGTATASATAATAAGTADAAAAGAWVAPPPAERWSDDPGDAIYYEIFVRSFQDASGDGHGDFRGLRARLGHLEALGVTGIWLMPIHPSPTYHGYDVVDYRAIHPDYGTLADFLAFLDEAHARGMRVILDLVVNHTSSAHPWFRAALAGDPHYRDYYVWSDVRLDWRGTLGGSAWHAAGDGTYYLGLFEGGMPDLDHRNPAVTEAMLDVASFWVDLGVDGFRIDAIQHVVEGEAGRIANAPENYAWVRDFNAALRERHPGVFIVGETWTATPAIAAYHAVAGLDMSFNYPLWRAMLAAVTSRSAIDLRAQLLLDEEAYPPGARRGTFLANHDHIRPATQVGPLRRDERRLALAAGLLLTLPGTPFLYYGEEIGLPNGPSTDDRDKRTPMRWTADEGGGFTVGTPWRAPSTLDARVSVAAQRADPESLLAAYTELIAFRRASEALARGELRLVPDLPSSLLAFWREGGGERLLVVANLAAGTASVAPERLGADGPLRDALSGEPVEGDVELSGTTLRILAVD
jgi:alpha-amylase